MPIYVYKCESCEQFLEISHGMNDSAELCPLCENENSLTKIPSFLNIKINKENKVGSVVKSYIEKTKKEFREEKDNFKKRKL